MNEQQATIIGFYLTLLGLAATIIALIYTIRALHMAKSQTQDLESLKGNAEAMRTALSDSENRLNALSKVARDISGSVSTKAIGSYPDYVDAITGLLNQATDKLNRATEVDTGAKSIIIVCDVPCYCMFSGQKQWLDYKNALEKAALNRAKRRVQIVWMNSERRMRLLKEQFKPSGDNDVSDWKNKVIRDRLTPFLENHARDKDVESITYAEFTKIVEEQHAEMIDNLQAVQPKEHPDRLHLLFWIVDSEEAIFAIPNLTDRGQGLGFYTRDNQIINGLRSIHSRLEEEGQEPKELSMKLPPSRADT